MRKGDGADGQRAKVMGNFTTEDEGEERMLQTFIQSRSKENMHVDDGMQILSQCLIRIYVRCVYFLIF